MLLFIYLFSTNILHICASFAETNLSGGHFEKAARKMIVIDLICNLK